MNWRDWLRLRIETAAASTASIRGIVPLPIAVAGVAMLVQFARRPEALLRPQFYAEGGPVFYIPTYFADPLTLLTSPYAGYLHLVPRMIAYAERTVDPAWAPSMGAIASYVIVAAIAAFIASRRMSNVLPAVWQRLTLAGMLVATPSVHEILGVDVNIQVYLAAYLAALAVSVKPISRVEQVVDAVGAAAASLSGPFALLLAPLFWRRRGGLAVLVTACALIQLAVIIMAPQRPFSLPSPSVVVDVAALRINAAVLGATLGSAAPAALAAGLITCLAIMGFRSSGRLGWAPLAYAAIVVAAGGLLSDGEGLAIHARWGERFFLLPSLAAAALVIVGLRGTDKYSRVLSRALGILLVVGVTTDFRVPAFRDTDWVQSSRCVGSEAPCVADGEPEPYDIVWPGAHGAYPIPNTRPTDSTSGSR